MENRETNGHRLNELYEYILSMCVLKYEVSLDVLNIFLVNKSDYGCSVGCTLMGNMNTCNWYQYHECIYF